MKGVFENQLDTYGSFAYKIKGVSMLPLLKQDRDVVAIVQKKDRLHPMDVAFYKRNNDYVLHRVIKATDDGYLIRGDNTYVLEHVKEERVLGIMKSFVRNGKHIDCSDHGYRFYSWIWNLVFPVRHLALKAKKRIRRLL